MFDVVVTDNPPIFKSAPLIVVFVPTCPDNVKVPDKVRLLVNVNVGVFPLKVALFQIIPSVTNVVLAFEFNLELFVVVSTIPPILLYVKVPVL